MVLVHVCERGRYRPDKRVYDGPWSKNKQEGEALLYSEDKGWVTTLWKSGTLTATAGPVEVVANK